MNWSELCKNPFGKNGESKLSLDIDQRQKKIKALREAIQKGLDSGIAPDFVRHKKIQDHQAPYYLHNSAISHYLLASFA